MFGSSHHYRYPVCLCGTKFETPDIDKWYGPSQFPSLYVYFFSLEKCDSPGIFILLQLATKLFFAKNLGRTCFY